jgi:selenophosphate synthase
VKPVFRIAAAALLAAAPVFAQDKPADKPADNSALIREKVKADKKLLVASNMKLTEAEDKAFWPIYDAYQKDLAAINERLGKTIKAYADVYNAGTGVNDEMATKLGNEVLAIDQSVVDLNKTYFAKAKAVIPAAKAARYIQIERKIRQLLQAELADQIPLVP